MPGFNFPNFTPYNNMMRGLLYRQPYYQANSIPNNPYQPQTLSNDQIMKLFGAPQDYVNKMLQAKNNPTPAVNPYLYR